MDIIKERPRYERRKRNTAKPTSYMQVIVRQLIICTVLIGLVLGAKVINNDTSKIISTSVRNTLFYTIDYQTTVNNIIFTIKKLPQLWNKPAKDNDKNDNNTETIPKDEPSEANKTI